MKRILFLLLWVFLGISPKAQGAIEIYANGHKYDSLQAYLASKKSPAAKISPFEDQNKLSDAVLHKLCVLSIENGVIGALRDFYEARGQSDFPSITSDRLQEAIEQAVRASNGPKLLISQPGKVRIMALTAQDVPK